MFDPELTPEAFGRHTSPPQTMPINPPALTYTPRSSPAPSLTPAPRFNNPPTTDPSEAGLVTSSLGGNTLRSLQNERFRGTNTEPVPSPAVTSRDTGNFFGPFYNDFDNNHLPLIGNGPNAPYRNYNQGFHLTESSFFNPSGVGRSSTFTTDPNLDWQGNEYRTTGNQFTELPGSVYDETQYRDSGNAFAELPGSVYDERPLSPGEPRVELARRDGNAGMDDEPVLFDDPGAQRPSLTIDTSGGQSPGGMAPAGYDISRFGSNMTIGQFLNTPLAFMRFGENRGTSPSPVGRGTIDLTQSGRDAYMANPSGGGRSPNLIGDPNQDWTGISPEEQKYYTDRGEAPPVTGVSPEESQSGSAPPASAPSGGSHWDFTKGQYVANNNDTGAQFNSQAANALMMWFQSMGGNTNAPTTGDAGRDIYRSGYGRLNEFGDIETVEATNRPGSVFRDPRYVEPSQEESKRLGLTFDAKKKNAWIVAHNPWLYGKG